MISIGKRAKRNLEARQADKERRIKLGCLSPDGQKESHDFEPWDCGCSFGCELCKYTKECKKCGGKI